LKLNIGAEVIEYQIDYRRRKTMAISINRHGTIRVAAPRGTAARLVHEWVRSKSGWIAGKLAEIQVAQGQQVQRSYQTGESLPFLGQDYTLRLQPDSRASRPRISLAEGTLTLAMADCSPTAVRQTLETWYRNAARRHIHQRLEHYQTRLGKRPGRIAIRDQQTRWGSCSAKGNLNFNWRVMMAPATIVDYLVVHELCHLVHLDHSPQFWNLVAAILPDYRERKEWLRKNGPGLQL